MQAGAGLISRRLACLMACHLAAVGSAFGESTPALTPLERISIALVESETPPPGSAPWQSVQLPDDWSRSRPGVASNHAWYRIDFSLTPEQLRLTAVYVPRVSMSGQPFLNGGPLSSGMRFTEPLSYTWYYPQFHWIPAALLKTGRNVLHYRVRCYQHAPCGLAHVFIGAPEPLQAQWRRQYFWQITAPQSTTAITLAMFLSVLVARLLLGAERSFLYFGLATLGWAAYVGMSLTTAPPLPVNRWAGLMFAVLNCVLVAMTRLTLLYTGKEHRLLSQAATCYVVVSTLLLAFASQRVLFAAGTAMYLIDLGLGLFLARTLWNHTARHPSAVNKLILFCAALTTLLGGADGLMLMNLITWPIPALGHFGVNLVFMSAFWAVLGQALTGRRQALHEAHAARTLAAERERIMRDMHDGIGSQLLAAKGSAERQVLGQDDFLHVLDECIDDLRLMIDSLDLPEGDLQAVLGNLRYRLSARLPPLGVRLSWEVVDLPPMSHLTSSDTLNLLRILQEAFSNLLQHSQASEAIFTASARSDGGVILQLRDDGRGFDQSNLPAARRGLENMKRRAAALGAALRIEASPGRGCVVRLELPPAAPVRQNA